MNLKVKVTFPLNMKDKGDKKVNFPIDTSLKIIVHSALVGWLVGEGGGL